MLHCLPLDWGKKEIKTLAHQSELSTKGVGARMGGGGEQSDALTHGAKVPRMGRDK